MSTKARMIERVRGLLRMAEDPAVTDAESQAFTAKAAELMTRHAIAEAEARAERGEEAETVTRLDFPVPGTGGHGKARVQALAAIAGAYGCRSAVRGNTSAATERTLIVLGTRSALDSLQMLLPSVSLQMEASARFCAREHVARLRERRSSDRSALAGERNRYYRSFVRAYGDAVAQRIVELRTRIAEESGAPGGDGDSSPGQGEDSAPTTGTEVVLRSDVDRVNEEFDRRFPDLRTTRGERTFSRDGYRAGYVRGSRAQLGIQTAVGSEDSDGLPQGIGEEADQKA
jgi:hypothetical protein